MSLMPKSECIPTFEFKTTFTRPSPDGEPPDVRILSHDNGSFTVKKGEPPTTPVSKRPKSKPVFNKQELLEFFMPLFTFWNKEIEQAKVDIESVECHTNKSRLEGLMNGKSSCYFMLQEYIEENGGE